MISTPAEREGLLERIDRVILNTEKKAQSYAGVSSPFLQESAVASAEQQMPPDTGLETEAAETEPVVLPDKVALDLISERFRPLGSMVIGERGFLQLASGRTIEEGESFRAAIQGFSYTVHLEAVTSSGYRLRLKTATVEKSFMDTKTGQSR
ncbi:MAG: hypothetical protein R6V45_03000 [Oceanipulchritudo sp.]